MTATTCPWCGSQTGIVPWARQHAATCPQHQAEDDGPPDPATALVVHAAPTRY